MATFLQGESFRRSTHFSVDSTINYDRSLPYEILTVQPGEYAKVFVFGGSVTSIGGARSFVVVDGTTDYPVEFGKELWLGEGFKLRFPELQASSFVEPHTFKAMYVALFFQA